MALLKPAVTISSWTEFATWVEGLLPRQAKIVFRGEPSPTFQLRPKAGRVGRERGSARKVEYKKEDEIAALERFRKDARPFVSPEPRNDLEWLAVARHHGVRRN